MPLSPEKREEMIRPLVTAGLSTRDIEKVTDIPQSTVVRDIKRINTGEHPIQQPATAPASKRLRLSARGIGLGVAALLILAVAIGSLTFLRDAQPRQVVYTPVFQSQDAPVRGADYYVCFGITIEGYLSDAAQATGRKCPKGWKMLELRPGN